VSRFEYLSVLVSIVIALGISEIASSWGRLLRNRARVDFYWLHALWSLFTIVLMIQFWWGFWGFREVERWSFLGLAAVVGEALVLVLAALVLLPDIDAASRLDLRSHYFEQSRLYFLLGALLIVQLGVVDHWVAGQPLLHPENAIRLPGAVLAAVAAASRNEKLHAGLAAAAALLLVGFVIFSFSP
jgi:hypothetical protein